MDAVGLAMVQVVALVVAVVVVILWDHCEGVTTLPAPGPRYHSCPCPHYYSYFCYALEKFTTTFGSALHPAMPQQLLDGECCCLTKTMAPQL